MTWTVQWSRANDPELLTCRGLTPDLAIRRLREAIRNSGPITVHAVKREVAGIPVQEDPSMPRDKMRLVSQ